ncbi:cell division control protein 48 homolog C-like [Primulina huaijiensis]|uniref:cell division control protein 48 homolog C-like n=1 Tax=Primulina huaijiensis TaxID=1492673 RepID=UPI003CC6DF0E
MSCPLARGRFSVQTIVKWEEVGGLLSLKKELEKYIVYPIKALKDNQDFWNDQWTRILLYGPPGCGKTLIAKAVANKVGANFIPFQGLGMLCEVDKDLKSALRKMFDEARAHTPCILFFDHVDVFCIKSGEKGGYVMEQLFSQLLLELEKLEAARGVYVIGTTNRPDLLDPALLTRKGFNKILHVPLPSPEERGLILTAIGPRKKIDVGVDLMALGQRCEGFSGADLVGLIDEAAMFAMEEVFCLDKTIKEEHFKKALEKITPSVWEKVHTCYTYVITL